jgi:hypothetical protein
MEIMKLFKWKRGIDYTNHKCVTSIRVDNFSSMVYVTFEDGLNVNNVGFTMEDCQQSGFINFENLSNLLP